MPDYLEPARNLPVREYDVIAAGVGTAMGVIYAVPMEAANLPNEHEHLDILSDFDPLYRGFYDWLAGQYAPNCGGFYYAVSSREDMGFQPDLESTGQALNILERSGLLHAMPSWMKTQIIAFFHRRQVPEGYFYDPQNEMRTVDRMVARALSYSANCLQMLDAKPLFPLPGKGVESRPAHLRTLAAYRKWLDERPWNYAWMGGDHVSAASVYLQQMPTEERDAFMNITFSYLADRQDPATGLWGEGRPYIKISGAFKLAMFYRNFAVPLPRADRIYQSILRTLREDNSADMCWTRNPMDLLGALAPQIGPFPPPDVLEILRITLDNLRPYLKPDGGFSRHVDRSLAVPNNVPLGKGLPEGDMNAGTQALRIRSLARQLAGQPDTPLAQYTAGFYEKVDVPCSRL